MMVALAVYEKQLKRYRSQRHQRQETRNKLLFEHKKIIRRVEKGAKEYFTAL